MGTHDFKGCMSLISMSSRPPMLALEYQLLARCWKELTARLELSVTAAKTVRASGVNIKTLPGASFRVGAE